MSTTDPEWMAAGLCAQTDPEAFFPEVGGTVRPAKRVCAACPVRVACLEYALATRQRYGVWGGLGRAERVKLEQRRAAAAQVGSVAA